MKPIYFIIIVLLLIIALYLFYKFYNRKQRKVTFNEEDEVIIFDNELPSNKLTESKRESLNTTIYHRNQPTTIIEREIIITRPITREIEPPQPIQRHIEENLTFGEIIIGAIMGNFEELIPAEQARLPLNDSQNAHDPNVIDGIKTLVLRLKTKYDPDLDQIQTFMTILPVIRQDLVETCQKQFDNEKFKQKISSYDMLTPHQAFNMIFTQVLVNTYSTLNHPTLGPQLEPENKRELETNLNNATEAIALALADAYRDSACATGIFNRICASTETFDFDGMQSVITTDGYIREAIFSRMGQLRDKAIAEERSKGDKHGFVAYIEAIPPMDDIPTCALARLQELKKEIEGKIDAEFGEYRFYRKNKEELMSNLF